MVNSKLLTRPIKFFLIICALNILFYLLVTLAGRNDDYIGMFTAIDSYKTVLLIVLLFILPVTLFFMKYAAKPLKLIHWLNFSLFILLCIQIVPPDPLFWVEHLGLILIGGIIFYFTIYLVMKRAVRSGIIKACHVYDNDKDDFTENVCQSLLLGGNSYIKDKESLLFLLLLGFCGGICLASFIDVIKIWSVERHYLHYPNRKYLDIRVFILAGFSTIFFYIKLFKLTKNGSLIVHNISRFCFKMLHFFCMSMVSWLLLIELAHIIKVILGITWDY
jgi:hypothetical protein